MLGGREVGGRAVDVTWLAFFDDSIPRLSGAGVDARSTIGLGSGVVFGSGLEW